MLFLIGSGDNDGLMMIFNDDFGVLGCWFLYLVFYWVFDFYIFLWLFFENLKVNYLLSNVEMGNKNGLLIVLLKILISV